MTLYSLNLKMMLLKKGVSAQRWAFLVSLGVHLGKLKAVVLYIKFYLGIKSQGGSFKSKFNQCSLSKATTLESGTKMKHENTCST